MQMVVQFSGHLHIYKIRVDKSSAFLAIWSPKVESLRRRWTTGQADQPPSGGAQNYSMNILPVEYSGPAGMQM